jgi:hypothetical protein
MKNNQKFFKHLKTILIFTVYVCVINFPLAFGQTNNMEDKIWSKISKEKQSMDYSNPNYRYIPNFNTQRFSFSDFDAVVQANFRILPTTNTTQSELSIDINPTNPNIIFAGSNGTSWPVSGVYGTGVYWTTNSGTTWTGYDNPPFGSNSGDPAAVIGLNGNFYMGYIRDAGGQGVSVSTNNGSTWTSYIAGTDPSSSSDLLDKNHLWVDKKNGSPYSNRVYDAWTHFVTGSASENQVVINYSSNNGVNWSSFIDLSTSLTPGSHAQGVNINTGPNGEVYATFAIYDDWTSSTYGEDAIGFAKSTDGGITWTKIRAYDVDNFGIRGNLKSTSIRVSSFPSMTVDRSGGPRNGYIYICWPQRGVSPAGSDPDIVMIRSTNGGSTWSAPIRVNNDAINNGKDQYYPWCAVDQSNGQLHVVFYDNRNTTTDSSGVWMATSNDGGLTFENFQISNANFKPKPISGLASGYQGDYIGITAANGKAYPLWADDRTGNYQAWSTVVTFGPSITHIPLSSTENLFGPYVVNATITSINPLISSSVKVYWGRGIGVINDSLIMSNSGGSNYTVSIPGNGISSTYNYYIKATDNQGYSGFSPAGAPAIYNTFIAAIDNVPPTITHTPIQNLTLSRFPPTVLANVTDSYGIQSVICEYRVNGGGISNFNLSLTTGSTYSASFPNFSVSTGDIMEYRIKAVDNSSQHNIAYNPGSNYYSFTIVSSLGDVLVVDDDVTLFERASSEKGGTGDQSTPLGASANLFTSVLTAAGYTVDQVNFSSFNTATLSNYDVVILSAGVKESSIFNDATKRTALINFTKAGGKTIVEGGEVGYLYRKATTELDVAFRRNLLLDSVWVSDRSGASLQSAVTTHSIFHIPNAVTSPIPINNGGTSGYGARDEMTVLSTVTGINRIANWVGGTAANAGIFIYNPMGDTTKCRNIFFSFSIGQIVDQTNAGNLIVNSVKYLMRDLIPTNKTLNITALIEGMWNGSTSAIDTLTLEIRSTTSPYTLVESKKILTNNLGYGTATFTQPSENTPYYLVVKHRNSIETWSAIGVQFITGSLMFDFTTVQSQAYGNNLKLKDGKWCIYSGDINQDGIINLTDQSQVFIDNISGALGYISTDLNGDYYTEVGDLNIVFLNRTFGISVHKPSVSQININISE